MLVFLFLFFFNFFFFSLLLALIFGTSWAGGRHVVSEIPDPSPTASAHGSAIRATRELLRIKGCMIV